MSPWTRIRSTAWCACGPERSVAPETRRLPRQRRPANQARATAASPARATIRAPARPGPNTGFRWIAYYARRQPLPYRRGYRSAAADRGYLQLLDGAPDLGI